MKNTEFDVNSELNREIGLPVSEEKTDKLSHVKNAIKSVFIPNVQTDNKLISADEAYLRATYKEYTSRKKIFRELVQLIKDKIRINMEQNKLYTLVEIEPEMMDYVEEIKSSLSNYDYQVWILGKTELENLNPEVKVNKTTMFMLIMWDKVY